MDTQEGMTAAEWREHADWLESKIVEFKAWAEEARARADALDAKEALS
jgi:hypothetical protein